MTIRTIPAIAAMMITGRCSGAHPDHSGGARNRLVEPRVPVRFQSRSSTRLGTSGHRTSQRRPQRRRKTPRRGRSAESRWPLLDRRSRRSSPPPSPRRCLLLRSRTGNLHQRMREQDRRPRRRCSAELKRSGRERPSCRRGAPSATRHVEGRRNGRCTGSTGPGDASTPTQSAPSLLAVESRPGTDSARDHERRGRRLVQCKDPVIYLCITKLPHGIISWLDRLPRLSGGGATRLQPAPDPRGRKLPRADGGCVRQAHHRSLALRFATRQRALIVFPALHAREPRLLADLPDRRLADPGADARGLALGDHNHDGPTSCASTATPPRASPSSC